jgi:hypothetical protein
MKADQVECNQYAICDLTGTQYLLHKYCTIWFIVRRWVWDSDMPEAVLADEMSLGKTSTSMPAAMICKLLTGNELLMSQLTILSGNCK